MTEPSIALGRSIAKWLSDAKVHNPSYVSPDGTAVRVYADMGGTIFLRPDGTLVGEKESGEPMPVDDNWRTVALVVGARTHPELRELLPVRPGDAVPCNACAGTGLIHSVTCGACLGLGWKPAA